jgi:hypothetical protein
MRTVISMEGVMSTRQCEYGKHRLKRKVSIGGVKGDIAAKYQDLRIVRDKSSKQREMVQCYKLYQNISTSECTHQDMMKGVTAEVFLKTNLRRPKGNGICLGIAEKAIPTY